MQALFRVHGQRETSMQSSSQENTFAGFGPSLFIVIFLLDLLGCLLNVVRGVF